MNRISDNNNRFAWVDVSKGIVICLMVIGHSSIPVCLSNWIWSFHMPFFFFISSLFTRWDDVNKKLWFRRRINTLVIPFVVYSIINLLVYPLSLKINTMDYCVEVFENGWGGVALWFVPVFFLSSIICLYTPTKYLFQSATIYLTIGVVLCLFEINLPWTLSSIPFGAFLMIITRYFSDTIKKYIKGISLNLQDIVLLMIGLLISLFISHFWRLDMACNQISPSIPLIMGIQGGIIVIVEFSKLIVKIMPITYVFSKIGKNTFEIMSLSQVTISTINFFITDNAIVKYSMLILILGIAVCLRKLIEGKFANIEVI